MGRIGQPINRSIGSSKTMQHRQKLDHLGLDLSDPLIPEQFPQLIEAIYGRLISKAQLKERLAMAYFKQFQRLHQYRGKKHSKAFRDLLLHLHHVGSFDLLQQESLLPCLVEIAVWRNKHCRDIQIWQSRHKDHEDQLCTLAAHCFAQYPVPVFLNRAWLDPAMEKERQWYIHLGLGGSVRALKHMPIRMTKRIAHWFPKAPAEYSVPFAIRWAQFMGMGGKLGRAEYVLTSKLGCNQFKDEPFWEKVVQLFATKSIPANKIPELVNYLADRHQVESAFTIKNLQLKTLFRLSEAWHQQQRWQKQLAKGYVWPSSNIRLLKYREDDGNVEEQYFTKELLSALDLKKEGDAMQHCVGDYRDKCSKRESAIFSLRQMCVSTGVIKTLATIEINLNKRSIAQVQGKCNEPPTPKAKALIREWSRRAKLRISEYF